ncbi:MAG: hypothetical protein KDK99_15870 [Verrucomicrobiales bacterium]|nr:hypothetical protein [Verrucomicrobiales bacterium]
MDPLTPQDPLWKLLQHSREPKVHPQFTANVVRSARHTPQAHGWLARLRQWWEETGISAPAAGLGLAAAAAVAIGGFTFLRPTPAPGPQAVAVAETTPTPVASPVEEPPLMVDGEAHLESLMQMEALLAVEDTHSLSDQQIAFLLY